MTSPEEVCDGGTHAPCVPTRGRPACADVVAGGLLTRPDRERRLLTDTFHETSATFRRCSPMKHGTPSAEKGVRPPGSYRAGITNATSSAREGPLASGLTPSSSSGACMPVGFALVEILEPAAAHLEEIDVHPDHGRRGLGTWLVRHVCQWAEANGPGVVTLTTFRDVPWNMPFYAHLGFEEVAPAALTPALRAVLEDEARRGLDPMYGARVVTFRSDGVLYARMSSVPLVTAKRNSSQSSGLASLYRLMQLNSPLTTCRTPTARPLSAASGTAGSRTPVLWKWSSVSRAPLWQVMQRARPMKRRRPDSSFVVRALSGV